MIKTAHHWIRGPLWDGFWILSGLPIGLVLIFLGPSQRLAFFSLVVLMETGHSLSPIALAWTHTGFRRLMLEFKTKYVFLPLLVFTGSVLIGGITSLGFTEYRPGIRLFAQMSSLPNWRSPFPMVVWVYMIWNAYHFGMQNFGVLSIYRRKAGTGSRRVDMAFCLVLTCTAMALAFPISSVNWPGLLRWPCVALSLVATGSMVARETKMGLCLPRLIFILTDGLGLALVWWQPIIGIAVYSVNHWLVAIGLSSQVYSAKRYWAFALVMLLAGAVGFLWLIPTPNGNLLRLVPAVVGARLGLGFVHFLYDRHIWKMSAERVRRIVGPALAATILLTAVSMAHPRIAESITTSVVTAQNDAL